MWLIAGLGNPGSRYENTPHNLGYDVVALLAERHRMQWAPSKLVQGTIADGEIDGQKVFLLRPSTFMNLSGEAVGPVARYYRIHPAHTLVINDDVAIPWGRIRIRTGGSHGGHNGLRNLIVHLGTDQFPRIRIGCAPDGWKGDLADYVLAKLGGEALELARHMAQVSADASEEFVRHGAAKTQNKYNSYDAFKTE